MEVKYYFIPCGIELCCLASEIYVVIHLQDIRIRAWVWSVDVPEPFNCTVVQVHVQSSCRLRSTPNCSPVWLVCKAIYLRNPAGPWLTA